MSCRECKQYENCSKLTRAVECWEDYVDEDDDICSTGDVVESIEERLSCECDNFRLE